jgi:hypothetical protein
MEKWNAGGVGTFADAVDRPNRRRMPRKKVRWRALVLTPDGKKLPSYVVEVSEEGLRLEGQTSFKADTMLRLAVFIPDFSRVGQFPVSTISAVVRYQVLQEGGFQSGLELFQPSSELMDRIYAAVT